eukprot:TRINITY_DN80517_c0_g1_i1.p1 TRINITY_DN80517_c0_g1~~TRINITY_DN80517_c0_g1_i1.p1  ORF type:complete len:336 (+),score=24.48 TRINITY_DN80517_c0_g1_i1:81-1088(+)
MDSETKRWNTRCDSLRGYDRYLRTILLSSAVMLCVLGFFSQNISLQNYLPKAVIGRPSSIKPSFTVAPPFPNDSCALPEGAVWAIAKPWDGSPPFNIAVNSPFAGDSSNDDMSSLVRTRGYYEFKGVSEFPGLGPVPGTFLDVGANLGDWPFYLANAGWRVLAVEGGSHNVALMNATLCANPQFRNRLRISQALVGSKEQENKICSMCGKSNGEVVCGHDGAQVQRLCQTGFREYRVRFKTLQTILKESSFANVDAFKMDIEGFECEALAGYPEFAKHHALTWVRIETNQDHVKKCVQRFAEHRWQGQFGGEFEIEFIEGGTNAILTRRTPFILR